MKIPTTRTCWPEDNWTYRVELCVKRLGLDPRESHLVDKAIEDGHITLDAEGQIIYLSEAACDMVTVFEMMRNIEEGES